MGTTVAAAAQDYARAGLSVFPAHPTEKHPLIREWQCLQQTPSTPEETAQCFNKGRPVSPAVITGKVSGNLETIDFDEGGRQYQPWAQLINEQCPGLVDKLLRQSTQNGGIHVIYRCPDVIIPGNQKFSKAAIPVDGPGLHRHGKKSYEAEQYRGVWVISPTLIESRGEGGYFLAAPGAGYQVEAGSFLDIPTVSAEERQVMIEVAKALSEYIKEAEVKPEPQKRGTELRPGDAFNQSVSIQSLLVEDGWTDTGRRKSLADGTICEHWTRPGKTKGVSATVFDNKMHVFSTNVASLEADRTYTPFAYITTTMHHGDWQAAASAFAKAGYGEPRKEAGSFTASELTELASLIESGDTAGMKEILLNAKALDSIEQHTLLRKLKDRTGTPIEAMRSFLGDKVEKEEELDHLGYAKQVIEDFGPENILAIKAGCYAWLGKGVWEEVDPRTLKQSIQRVLDGKTAVNSLKVGGVSEVLLNDIYRPDHSFNVGDPEVINCINGELHLSKEQPAWTLKEHCRESYRTSQIPVVFDSSAKAPRFDRFLDEIFSPDEDKEEKIAALLEMIGYTLVAHCRHERFIILIGAGANGKSVILSVLENLVGTGNVAGVQPSQFNNKFQRAHLNHKLANIVTEIQQGEVISDAELKGIVSGEPASVETKFKDPFMMRPYATCWFATNHMPHTRDFSDALFRRALILKFNRTFSEKEQNHRLKDDLLEELPGILNLALSAYAKAVQDGFTTPSSSAKAKEEWRLEADQVQQFVEDWCVRDQYQEIESGKLYNAYRAWTGENGISRHLTQKSFRDRLTRIGFGQRRDRKARWVTGINKGDLYPSNL